MTQADKIKSILLAMHSEFMNDPHEHLDDCRSCQIKQLLLYQPTLRGYVEGQIMGIQSGQQSINMALMDMACLGFELHERLSEAEKLQELQDKTND